MKRDFYILTAAIAVMIIAVAVIGALNITAAPVFNVVLLAGLIGVTVMYVYHTMQIATATKEQANEIRKQADATNRQAKASVEMAEEMKEQRYDAVRPVIDIQRQTAADGLMTEALAAKSEDFSHGLSCRLYNIGVGPATDVYAYIYSFVQNIQTPGSGRVWWPFGTLAIGETTPTVKLLPEQKGDRMVLVAYYKDVHGRDIESRREVSVDKERNDWKIGPLETEVRKIAKGEHTK